jgi:general secretion pathway protein N
MGAFRLLALGAAAYGVFLVATLPASVVAPRVAAATKGQAALTDVGGTVWSGSARVAIAARGAAFTLDEVRWEFLPSRLLAGRAAFAVKARLGTLRGEAEVARSPLAWRADGLRAQGDASAIPALLPLAAAWQPAGEIALAADAVAWDGSAASGTASIEWRDAALALSPVRPLGTWRAEARAEGATAKVTLATVKGPLRLSGDGTLALPGRLAFSGEARGEPGRERDLEAVLALLGPRRPDGAHAISIR